MLIDVLAALTCPQYVNMWHATEHGQIGPGHSTLTLSLQTHTSELPRYKKYILQESSYILLDIPNLDFHIPVCGFHIPNRGYIAQVRIEDLFSGLQKV